MFVPAQHGRRNIALYIFAAAAAAAACWDGHVIRNGMIGAVGFYFMLSCEYRVSMYIGRHVGTAIVAPKNDTGQSNALVGLFVCLFVCFPKVFV